MIKMPPTWLSREQSLLLMVVSAPGDEDGLPPESYLRIGESGPFVAETSEEEESIQKLWPGVSVLRGP